MATPYQNSQMDKLTALQALTQSIAGQYGGGNDVKSVVAQNEAYVQAARQQGLTDAEIAAQVPKLPWNDSTRYIPSQSLMADELGPAPANAVSGGPAAPAPAPAAMPAPAPATPGQNAQPAPTFFQRMGQRFDQAATAGLLDPTTLTKEQRRLLRGQLLMNLGGALSQNRPVGEGFQQQYNMISSRQQDEAERAKKAREAEQAALRTRILSNVDLSSKQGVMGAIPMLSQAGLYDDVFKFVDYANKAFPNSIQVMSDASGTLLIDKERALNPDGSFNMGAVVKIPGTGALPKPAKPAAPANTWTDPETGIKYEIRNGLPYRAL